MKNKTICGLIILSILASLLTGFVARNKGYETGRNSGYTEGLEDSVHWLDEYVLDCFDDSFIAKCDHRDGYCIEKINNTECRIVRGTFILNNETERWEVGDFPDCEPMYWGACRLSDVVYFCECTEENGRYVDCEEDNVTNWDCKPIEGIE